MTDQTPEHDAAEIAADAAEVAAALAMHGRIEQVDLQL